MLTQHIALVPEEEGVNASELARVSAALQRQMTRDLAPIWGVVATVDAFPYLEDVPVGYWPVVLTFCELGRQGGVYVDANGQPYAQIQLSTNWSLAASRACLEMLVNPFASRTVTATSLRSGQGPVEFMIEVSGPCADARNAYTVNDVLVADFCTPAFYGGGAAHPDRYSFRGSLTAPLQILPGGHLTWYDPVTGSYWLRSHFGDNPIDRKLGDRGRTYASVRELLNACAPLCRASDRQLRETMHERIEHARRASHVQAHRLRALLGARLERDIAAADIVFARDREHDMPTLPTPPHLAADLTEPEYEVIDLSEIEEVSLSEIEEVSAPAAEAPAAATLAEPPALPSAEPPPPVERARPAARGTHPSLMPITLEDRGADRMARFKVPLAGALAGAAVVAVIWTGRVARDRVPPETQAASKQHAATAASAPAPAAARAKPPSVAVEARPAPPARRQLARREPKPEAQRTLPPPLPPPASPPSDVEQAAPAIEDLIGTRR